MNCTEITTLIDDYIDCELTPSMRQAFESHVSSCAACQKQLDRSKHMLSALANLPIEPPSEHFEQRVFSEVRHKYNRKHHYTFAAGFATAIAASFMLWFVSNIFFMPPETPETPAISIAMHEIRTVRLMIDAGVDIKQAQLSIDLPENMRIDGYPQNTQLSWQTDLSQGHNVLSLPLIAVEHGEGELVARLTYGEKTREYRIAIKTSDDGVLNYQLDEIKSA